MTRVVSVSASLVEKSESTKFNTSASEANANVALSATATNSVTKNLILEL